MKRSLLISALLFAAAQAGAQTVTVDRVTRHVGAGTGMVLSTHADLPACTAAVSASAPIGQSMCKVVLLKAVAPAPTPTPEPTPTPPPPTPAPGGPVTYYFSDCAAGAAAGCVQGSNNNPGTLAAPKQNLSGVNINALPAGQQLLFARGGAWDGFSVQAYNRNATQAAPIVFGAYGEGAPPLLRTTGVAFGFALQWGESESNGGYVVRNLRIDGGGTATAAISASKMASHITLEGLDVSRFQIAILMHDNTVRSLALRNSNIHDNVQHGLLGSGSNWTIEGNTFERNGDARPPSTHAIYFSSGVVNSGLVVRGNTFRDNSQQGGACRSGNLTAHGLIDGALIEGNTIEAATYGPGCRGISITAGYAAQEYMRNFVVRGNTVRNAGACVAFSAAPGIVIDGNKCVDNTANSFALIETASNPTSGGDDADGGAVVRNNIVCSTTAAAGALISVRAAAAVDGNTLRTGADSTTGPCAR